MEGQLWPAERAALYDFVMDANPRVVLEVGTWKGGGSTWQIVSALRARKNKGILYTCEINETFFNEATQIYTHDPQVRCYFKTGNQLLKELRDQNVVPDVLFMDGSEDPSEALEDFCLYDSMCGSGARFACHDWDLGTRADGLSSSKAALLRPHLEQNSNWVITKRLSAPESVGLVFAVKK